MKKILILSFFILVATCQSLRAQDADTIEKLFSIANREFPNNNEEAFSFGIEWGCPYFVDLRKDGFTFTIYVNDKMEKLYIKSNIDAPNYFPEFKKIFKDNSIFLKVQKQLAKYNKSLKVGKWTPSTYINAKNGILCFEEYQNYDEKTVPPEGQSPALDQIYFDLKGNFLALGKFDVLKKISVTLDYTKGIHVEEEGSGLDDITESVKPFSLNTKYYIRNIKTDLYLDIYGNSLEDRGRVVLYKHTFSTNQQFEIISTDVEGNYKIQNVNSQKVLSALPQGTNVIQFKSDAGERQVFTIENATQTSKGVKFKFVYDGFYLGYEGSLGKNGTNIYEKKAALDEAQEWELIQVEN